MQRALGPWIMNAPSSMSFHFTNNSLSKNKSQLNKTQWKMKSMKSKWNIEIGAQFAFVSEHCGRPRAAGAGNVRPLAALRGHDRGQRHRQRPRHHGRPQVAQHEKGTARTATTWLCV